MPASICPHCQTPVWVKDAQLNVARGYVLCGYCEGIFPAAGYEYPLPPEVKPEQLFPAKSNVDLVVRLGARLEECPEMSRAEIIAELRDITREEQEYRERLRAQEEERLAREIEEAVLRRHPAKQPFAAPARDSMLHTGSRRQPVRDGFDDAAPANARRHSGSRQPVHDDFDAPSERTNWTLAVMVALTVLMMQLFYWLLLRK